ncbi:MAG: hypothetical protein Q7S40_29995 [Opitutaceae bacterium]|nr:hypothetical protein [Opitutaceae bacterium]
MKFEDLENAWSSQPTPLPAVDFAALQRATWPEMRRRTRFLRYELGGAVFVLIAYPLLSVANYLYHRPANALLFWGNVAVHVAGWIAVLGYTLRRLRRHRALLRESAGSVRSFATVSLEATAAEMRENRLALALTPLVFGLAWLSGYARHPAGYTAEAFATQTVIVAAILLPLIGAVWRHHRRYLAPRKEQLQDLLRDLP